MKYLICFFIAFTCIFSLKSQVIKYRAKYVSIKSSSDKNERTWAECYLLVVVDTVNNRITVHTESKQNYDIVKILKDDIKELSYYTLTFKAINENGEECILGLSTVIKREYNALLIISFTKYSIVYKLWDL